MCICEKAGSIEGVKVYKDERECSISKIINIRYSLIVKSCMKMNDRV